MADIDNIPLEIEQVPQLSTYDAGLLWNPENGASNEDWWTAIRTHLDLAEDHYEAQFDAVVDAHLRSIRQNVLLAGFLSRILSAGIQHGIKNETVKHVEGGLQVSDPFLLTIDSFIREYQKIDGSFPIQETEGFKQWEADYATAPVTEPEPEPAPANDPEPVIED